MPGCLKRDAVPPRTVVDLAAGESTTVNLINGKPATVELLGIMSTPDSVRGAVRETSARLKVNGRLMTIGCGNYHVPVDAPGVRVDCTATRAYSTNSLHDSWALEKDARIRLWPAGAPLIDTENFVYPVRQKWFANDTQMANEPAFVNGGEEPGEKIYYHSGLDFGGCEGMTEVVAATAGKVIQLGDKTLTGYGKYPLEPRYESIYILGEYGWVYRYSHVTKIEPTVRLGGEVEKGQRLAYIGKEGNSGGWAHLHFEIYAKQPSGRWATEEGFAYVVETYIAQFRPALLAVARPHRIAHTGEAVALDARRSLAPGGEIARVQWTFSDGTRAEGPIQRRTYETPGTYSEVAQVEDNDWNASYDFTVVQVYDATRPDVRPPAIHAAYHPTTGIKPGTRVTFKVRSFNTESGEETWDFGDGSPATATASKPAFAWNNKRFQQLGLTAPEIMLAADGYASVEHTFSAPGRYLVRVERTGDEGLKAVAHLNVEVEGEKKEQKKK